jgi:hypothetical protein
MRYQRNTLEAQQKLDERTFRLILKDYLVCRERDLLWVGGTLWEREVARWLNRAGGMAGKW